MLDPLWTLSLIVLINVVCHHNSLLIIIEHYLSLGSSWTLDSLDAR